MSADANRAVGPRSIAEALNAGNLDAANDLVHPAGVVPEVG